MTFPRTWLAALVSSLLASAPVGAVTIGFAPGSTEAGLGEAVSVDVVVSDLGGEIVSAYDLDIVFDDGALRFDGATQTNALGDPSLFQAFLDATSGPGLVDLAGVSLLSDAALLGLQGGDTVTLATLVFTRVGAGTATVGFVFDAVNDLKGSGAQILPLDPVPGRITDPAEVIPEPSAALTFGVGMIAASWALRRT